MRLLFNRLEGQCVITEGVQKPAARNTHNSREVMEALLDDQIKEVKITEEVLKAAAEK